MSSMPITKKWILAPRVAPDLIDHLLAVRGVTNREQFLQPRFPRDLHDPYRMKGMTETIERLARALVDKEPIGIFADYDTDGTPGAALLLDGFRQLGSEIRVYVPTRAEGYGLSELGLAALKKAGARVVVAIDLGITAVAAATFAQKEGIDLIILDHHVVQDHLFPRAAYAVVNPKQTDCSYPFKELCGGGIVWKVYSALLFYLEERHPSVLGGRLPEVLRRWALDLAAISTLCDMVPLLDENRVIASYGLRVLQQTRRLGLKALLDRADTDPARVTAGTVGFQIGPRINAPTRLGAESYQGKDIPGPQCSPALALLLSQDQDQAAALADSLQLMNGERQVLLERVLGEAIARVEAEGLAEKKVIFLAGEQWPAGIVGLVAGRLLERYGRPAVVLGLHNGQAVGSARSIDGFHLVDALRGAEERIEKFGGHAKAAGLTVSERNLATVYDHLLAQAEEMLTDGQVGPRLLIDAAMAPEELTLVRAKEIEALAPHGIGNPRPTFYLSNVVIESLRGVGSEGQHLKMTLVPADGQGKRWRAIGFRMSAELRNIQPGERVDIAFQVALNEWNGEELLDLHLVGVKPSGEEDSRNE